MEFEEIYATYFSDVYMYIRRLSRDEHLAEEITSETFFKAISSIESFRGDCDIRVWLCQIAKNCYFSYLKKTQRIDSIEDIETAEQSENFEERFFQKDAAMQIQKVLHDIPDPYKEVFMWRVFAEMSFKQIGQIFHKSENWACVTYHRARKMIKERLEADDYEK
jgi:RNA polymerase sigma-70 factor (ECF subfamily)